MPALRAWRGFSAGLFGEEVVAADAVEGDLAPLGVIQRPVAPVVVDPKHRENAEDQQSVQDDIEGEIGRSYHAATSQEALVTPR